MIPLPIPPWLSIKAIIGLAFALCFFLIGMGVHKTFSDRKIARMEREWAEQSAKMYEQLVEAEQHARKVESRWRADSVRMEKAYGAALAQRDRIVRNLVVAGDSLQQRLTAVTDAARSAAASSAACRDIHQRVETLGVLLAERDRMAGESEQVADTLRDELALCRGYVEVVTQKD